MLPHHLHGNFGLRFQAYAEECALHGVPLRGRYMFALVCREFDIDRDRCSMIGAIQLLAIPCDQYSIPNLVAFHDKVHFVLNQIPLADRPQEPLMGKWLFERLKPAACLNRWIVKIKDSKEKSKIRSFDYLWEKLEIAIKESRHEVNAKVVTAALTLGPKVKAPPNPYAKAGGAIAPVSAAAAKALKRAGKAAAKAELEAQSAAGAAVKAKAKAKAPKPKTPKAKVEPGSPRFPSTKDMSAAAKLQHPCMFQVKGICTHGLECQFSHEGN